MFTSTLLPKTVALHENIEKINKIATSKDPRPFLGDILR